MILCCSESKVVYFLLLEIRRSVGTLANLLYLLSAHSRAITPAVVVVDDYILELGICNARWWEG